MMLRTSRGPPLTSLFICDACDVSTRPHGALLWASCRTWGCLPCIMCMGARRCWRQTELMARWLRSTSCWSSEIIFLFWKCLLWTWRSRNCKRIPIRFSLITRSGNMKRNDSGKASKGQKRDLGKGVHRHWHRGTLRPIVPSCELSWSRIFSAAN